VAHVQKVKRASGDRWRIVYFRREPDGRRVKTATGADWDLKREAKRELPHYEREEAIARLPKRQQPTMREWIAETIGLNGDEGRGWIVTPRSPLRATTRERYRVPARRYLVPELGGCKLGDLTTPMLEAFFTRLDKRGVGIPTQHVLRKMLHSLYAAAVKAGHVSSNPISAIELPAEEEREPRFLSVAEVDAIAEQLDGADRALLLTLCYTGLRVGEAIALRVADVDLERRRITVRSSISEANGHPVEGKTKTRRIRSVRIPTGLLDVLAEQTRSKLPGSRIFSNPNGADIRASNWRNRVFYPAVSRAGIEKPRPTVHDLRHTAASLMIASDQHPKVVSEALGHANIGITMDRYGHLFDSLQDEAGDRLDAYLTRERKRATNLPQVVTTPDT
jgi:integrase